MESAEHCAIVVLICRFWPTRQPARLRCVRDLQVHFSHRQQPDYPLVAGTHRLARRADGSLGLVAEEPAQPPLARFSLDRLGLWLRVAEGVRSIHVNGRPIRRLALLRAGDALHVDGEELLLRGRISPVTQLPPAEHAAAGDDDGLLLRGVGGPHHGRCFALRDNCLVGSASQADIVIDDPVFAARHACIERHGEKVLLRDLGSEEGSAVNGVRVRHCWLHDGDQLVFDARHRFVLELPRTTLPPRATSDEPAATTAIGSADRRDPTVVKVARWPWLLLSALLLAGLLSALLWYGAR